jgi:hypothetical protein
MQSADPIFCANVLTLFYNYGRGHELQTSLEWIEAILINHAYISGTLYYVTAESFLFFVSRLLAVAADFRRRVLAVFKVRVQELFGQPGDALALSMRIISAASVRLADTVDYERLIGMQDQDGAWRPGWIYRFCASGILVGNDGLTTALAIRAIRAYMELSETNGHAS